MTKGRLLEAFGNGPADFLFRKLGRVTLSTIAALGIPYVYVTMFSSISLGLSFSVAQTN